MFWTSFRDPCVLGKRECACTVTFGTSVYQYGANDGTERFGDVVKIDTGMKCGVLGGWCGEVCGDPCGCGNQPLCVCVCCALADTLKHTVLSSSGLKRSAHTLCGWKDRYLVAFGGWSGAEELEALHVFDVVTHEWEVKECMGEKPSARHFHAGWIMGDSMYIFGGYDGHQWLNDMYKLDLTSYEWSEVCLASSSRPCRRASSNYTSLGVRRNGFVMAGGYNGEKFLDDMWMFDVGSESWEELKRDGHAEDVGEMKKKRDGDDLSWTRTYSTAVGHWMPALSGGCLEFMEDCGVLVLFGGRHKDGRFNSVRLFHVDQCRWWEPCVLGIPPTARKTASSFVAKSKLYIHGGHDGSSWLGGEMHVLDLSSVRNALSSGVPKGRRPEAVLEKLHNDAEFGSRFSDCKIVVEEREFLLHKSVVCTQSETLDMLVRNTLDGQSVVVSDISCELFEVVVKFLYTGELEVSPDLLLDVLNASHHLLIEALSLRVQHELVMLVTTDNVVPLYAAADHFNALELKTQCREFIMDEWGVVSYILGDADIPHELVVELLTAAQKNKKKIRRSARLMYKGEEFGKGKRARGE